MERKIETYLGEEITVIVYFDFHPYEPPERDYPGCDSDVTINAVYVDGDENKDISGILNGETMDCIKMKCFESVK